MLDLLKAVDGRIPNFAGIKYTFESLYEYNQCRLYKDGKYDNYKIKVYMKGSMGKNIKEYCHRGDIIGIKGHIENNMKLVIDKASFLSSSHKK